MGIFGFGVLRDQFASVVPHATIARTGYVVCFDITPIVVCAIRHSADENDFAELFRRRMESSKEVRFLRNNPPYALRYTLDNRAPLAKRQTQVQRLLDARPIVTRLATTTATRRCDRILRIKDVVSRIREILLRDFVLTASPRRGRGWARHRVVGAATLCDSSSGDDDNASATATATATASKKCKIVDSGGGEVTFAQANRIEFDYDEGEGEIKAINWLAKHKGRLRLIMARDNDVFVYILSKMVMKRNDDSYLVYHEGSNDVLLCWDHLRAYYGTCWMLLLWLSVCFGNDFTFGILDKSIATVSHYYPLLERHFIATNVAAPFAPSRSSADSSGGGGIVSIQQFASSTASEGDRHNAGDVIVKSLTMAFCELQNILRHGNKFDDRAVKRNGNVATAIASSSPDKSDDDENDDDIDDGYVHLWITRQLWSFFYTLELPSEFTKNQRFQTCPTLRINASFDKPFISNETFLRLREVDFQRHIESILRYGV